MCSDAMQLPIKPSFQVQWAPAAMRPPGLVHPRSGNWHSSLIKGAITQEQLYTKICFMDSNK